jgi:hypothetical protein
MKDNRKSPFISDLSKSVHTSQGIKKYSTLSYVTFDKFSDADFTTGTLIKDNSSSAHYEVVEGITSSLGNMTGSFATLSDFQVYGETVYTDVKVLGNTGLTLPIQQRGFKLPLVGVPHAVEGATEPKLVIKRSASDLSPSIAGQSRCFMLKIKVGPLHNSQSLLMIGTPGTAAAVFSIAFSGNILEVKHRANGSEAAQAFGPFNTPAVENKWVTLFVNAQLDPGSGRPSLGQNYIYMTATGETAFSAGPTFATHSALVATNPNLYLGYGDPGGGVNNNFGLEDFLCGVDIAEVVVFDRSLFLAEIDLIAKSHLKTNSFKSGFNNRAPRTVQQILDAKNSYPISSNPILPREPSSAFNDTTTKIFNSGTLSDSNELLMFPEMLPARLFSGSSIPTSPGGPSFSRGAVGDTDAFYRDVHNTPYDARLITTGQLRQGLSHKETELFDLSSRNSPITLSKDTALLGGLISPFDDTQPSVNYLDVPAVDSSVYPGLQQRLGDHVAIVIDLNPTTDSTIGVTRDERGFPTGEVTSMAYYNFSTKKWETSGENNSFIVCPPKKFTTGSQVTEATQMSFAARQVTQLMLSSSIAFAGTSGFTLFPEEDDPLTPLRNRGAPTSNYGFPQHPKYEAKATQLIDMSDYIDAPLIVERVSFEFGAAIEDSGPHSLGYARNSIPESLETANIDVDRIVSDIADNYPSIRAVSGPSNNDTRMSMNTTRAEFINGSTIGGFLGLPIGDTGTFPYTSQAKMFHSSSALDANSLLYDVSGWRTGSQEYSPISAVVRPHRQPTGSLAGPAPARIFLKTNFGPRWTAATAGSLIAGPMHPDSRKIEGGNYGVRVFSPLPVLAGGINGMVTGTLHPDIIRSASDTGPYVTLETNRKSALKNGFSEGQFLNLAGGGTPFWRADSFFLLRQTKKPVAKKVNYNLGVRSGYRTPHYPCAPWVFNKMLQQAHFLVSEENSTMLSDTYGIKFATASVGAATSGVDLNISIEFTGSTSREVITYGQMSHYGYVNAADSYMDNSHQYPAEFSSGTMNQTSKDQLFNAADSNRAHMIPFMGQAIKFARCNNFQYTAIPVNPENHITRYTGSASEPISLTSDFPDTSQGMYSSQVLRSYQARLGTGFGGFYPIRLEDNSGTVVGPHTPDPNNRNLFVSARYVMTGTQGGAGSADDTAAITLDTYAGYPTAADNTQKVLGSFDGEATRHSSVISSKLAGSGMSSIATPAYICDPDIPFAGRHTEFFNLYGTFDTPGSFTTTGWLSAGLSRDLDVALSADSTHQGINHSFNDSYCGFTLMTASTIHRPNAPLGRETAAFPLRADVYKRQYLNFRKDFKISVPVRAIIPSSTEPAGGWVFTTPGLVGYGDPGGITSRPQTNNWTASSTTPSNIPPTNNDIDMWVASERFSKRHTAVISQGGWSPGMYMDGLSSGRSFIRAALAQTPTLSKPQGPLLIGGAGVFHVASFEAGKLGRGGNVNWDGASDSFIGSILSGTQPEKFSEDSLYILKPGDKLALGVQPSLPGWNPGSALPNNRHARSFGIWDAEDSPGNLDGKGVLQDITHDILRSGEVRKESKANLDDPYEPAHGLTMLAGPSRIILYGTLLKDNKHRPADSTQKLRSNAVHEALHYDNPVLDQFMVDSVDEYDKSYLTDHITGSILNSAASASSLTGSIRGISATVGEGNLSFSGSFQRFVKVSEPSHVFYDTLLQNPFDIARVDAALGAGSSSTNITGSVDFAVVNLHQPTAWTATHAGIFLGNAPHALSSLWSSSFPFEGRYAGVRRMLNRDLSFANTNLVKVCLPSFSQTPSAPNTVPGDLSLLTGSNPDHLNTPFWEYTEAYTPSPGNFVIADVFYPVTGISNMANVVSNTIAQGSLLAAAVYTPGNIALAAKTAPPESIAAYRTFSAIMLGIGRQNKRCLDIDRGRFVGRSQFDTTNSSSVLISQRMHPSSLKYGYMNSDHINPSIVLRPDRHGQFRDMLEQRLYSKTYSTGDEFNKRGSTTAAVTCIFVDSQGAPIDDPHLTQCLNLSTAMTSSKPFIEGESLRELIINTESVTIS